MDFISVYTTAVLMAHLKPQTPKPVPHPIFTPYVQPVIVPQVVPVRITPEYVRFGTIQPLPTDIVPNVRCHGMAGAETVRADDVVIIDTALDGGDER
jgi:hypothetical protein